MKNIIIGKNSNLSSHLLDNIDNVELISSRKLINNNELINKYQNEPINIIINSFQPAIEINNTNNPIDYINNTILSTAIILEKVKTLNLNKLIYSSSSSVYGDNIYCKETDPTSAKNLHAALKIANEKLVEKFCKEHNFNFTITRIFNMYGGNDNFSIISKIINAFKNDEVLSLVNNGNAIRDFIYVEDVAKVYQYILSNETPNILNIGSGLGISIKSIIDYLENEHIFIKTSTKFKDEIKISTASVELLQSFIDTNNFMNPKIFIKNRLKK